MSGYQEGPQGNPADLQPAADPEPGEGGQTAPANNDPPATRQAFRLSQDIPSVARLSGKAMGAACGVAAAAIAGAVFYALQPATHKGAVEAVETQSHARPEGLSGVPSDYSKVPRLGAPLPGDLGRPILSARQNAVLGDGLSASAVAERDRTREQLAEERDTARTSKLFLGSGGMQDNRADRAQGAVGSPADTSNAPQAGVALGNTPDGNDQANKRAFLQVGQRTQTASGERLTELVSPYVLQAGSIIPAALITGIRSDLPGQITAQVTQNVYDSPTGRFLLIPQGARLIGEYDSGVSSGQSRVLLAWDRLILSDGRSILLDRQPGADPAGMAGLQDKTNYHWGAMMKAAMISTVLSIGTELADDSDNMLVRALREGGQDTLSQTGRQLVQKQMNIVPTITIRPGFPLRVIVTRDLILEAVGEQ